MSMFHREESRLLPADKVLSVIIDAQGTAPTTDAHGYEVTAAGKKGVRYLELLGAVRNAADDDEGAADPEAYVYFYVPEHVGDVKWIPAGGATFHRQAQILSDATGVKRNYHKIDKPTGATRVAFTFSDDFGGDTRLQLTVYRDT